MGGFVVRVPAVTSQERREILLKLLCKRTSAFYLAVMTGGTMLTSDGAEVVAPDFFFGDHEEDRDGLNISKPFMFGLNKEESPRVTVRSHSLKSYAMASVTSRRDGEMLWAEDEELVSCTRLLDHGRSFKLVNLRVNIKCRMLHPFSVISPGTTDFPCVEPTGIELIRSNGGWSNSANRLRLPSAKCSLWNSWLDYVLFYFQPVLEEVGLVSAIEAARNV